MYRVLAWIIAAPLYLLSLLPLRVHYFFSDIIRFLLQRVLKYRRKVIDINLKAALPEADAAARAKIAADYYEYLADVICEMVWSMTRSGRHIARKGFYRVDPEGEKVMNEAYRTSPSVMVLLAHTGNWELASDVPYYMQDPAFSSDDMTVAYQTLHSKLSEQLFLILRRVRLPKEGGLVPSHKVLRYMLQNRGRRRMYFFISDQYPYGGVSKTTKFLGLDTEWAFGGESVARKLHLPVLYVYLDRVRRGEYVIKISQICSDASLCREGEITQAYSALLEKDILSRNENWLWSHRRWKNILNYKI
ncbi:MAG: lysophospholipid acyltransferase family protein [Bacteroidales bacterium]|nr:lysophospholipid acyltransferase family protein [Bacteroidales bacterium]MBQ6080990.1 lysophospholipid acyltransferase family protein [Bacteroidales bacterium]